MIYYIVRALIAAKNFSSKEFKVFMWNKTKCHINFSSNLKVLRL